MDKKKRLCRKRFWIILITAAFLLFSYGSSPVQAVGTSVEDALKTQGQNVQTGQSESSSRSGQSSSLLWSFIQLVFVMLLLIGIIYLLIRFLSQRRGGRQSLGIKTIGVHPLTANRSIHVVAMEDRILILGVGDDVTLLQVIDDMEKVESWKQMEPEPSLPQWPNWKRRNSHSFDEMLREKIDVLKKQRHNIEQWDEDKK